MSSPRVMGDDRQITEEIEKPLLITVLGPTGVGKSSLALNLALEFGGEIVSADSRLIYRGMDIGTAKPTQEEQSLIPHHLFDIVAPDQSFTLAQYQAVSYQAIADIHRRGRPPFLVGGTGLYIRAVLEGFQIPRVPPDEQLRKEMAKSGETEVLYGRLINVDPEAAGRIDPKNVRRILRALEVYEKTGEPISALQKRTPPPFRALKIGLTMDRSLIYRRIDERVERMIAKGLVEEVNTLLAKGYSPELPAMSGVGYREIIAYLKGEMELEEASQRIKFNTHRLVREQYKWFRLTDHTIQWFDAEQKDFYHEVREAVSEFLRLPNG